MNIYCISDPHLNHAHPEKSMEKFGPLWKNHIRRIGSSWTNNISHQDIVLIPGDISWATHLENAVPDLKWLDQLPGHKILLKGNHDLWWKKTSELSHLGLNTLHFIDKSSIKIGNWEFFGARLWDTSEYECHDIINWTTSDGRAPEMYQVDRNDSSDKKYEQELQHLATSIQSLQSDKTKKIALFHYPPTNSKLEPTRALNMIQSVIGLESIVFGHLHQIKDDLNPRPFSGKQKFQHIPIYLCSCDYLRMRPRKIF